MSVWMRWLIAIAGSLVCFGACWALLAYLGVLDTGSQLGIAAVPLVLVLTLVGAWVERGRRYTSAQRVPQEHAVVQAGSDAVAVGRDLRITVFGPGDTLRNTSGQEGPLIIGDVPQEPVAFQSRWAQAEALERTGRERASGVFAVLGIRGVGKTQVAAAYARRRIEDGWRLVAWLDAGDEASIMAGLAQVAVAAGVGAAGEDVNVLALGVRHWLEADGERRLVVFDNATDLDLLRPFLPAGGSAQVIITSSRRSAAGLGTPVPVDVFTEDEALGFLAKRTGLYDLAGAQELAAELGFLPLGLAQAASLIAREHIGYRQYLERLRDLPVADYLTRTEGDAYPYRLAEAILLSLRAMEANDSSGLSRRLIDVVALLSVAGVPRGLLYVAGQEGLLSYPSTETVGLRKVDAALGRLANESLLTFSMDEKILYANRVIMRVAVERQVEEGTLAGFGTGVARLLSAIVESLGAPWQDRTSAQEMIQQIAALYEHLQPYIGAQETDLLEILLTLRGWVVWCLNQLGDSFAQAIYYGEQLVTDSERILGPTHPDLLSARNNLAYAYQAAGQLEKAMLLYQGTLVVSERALGVSDPRTLAARSNLSSAYLAAEKVPEAISLYEDVLVDYERILGKDHPDTLRARNNLASAYRAARRLGEAIPLDEQTLSDRVRILGSDHPSTVSSRSNLALSYLTVGRVAEAISLYEDALASYERILGSDHPDTLGVRNNLALAYQDAGRSRDSIRLLERTVSDYERILGTDHPDTLSARNNLAFAYRADGQLAEAIPLYERTLADRRRILGTDHPDTQGSLNNLMHAYRDAGRMEEAQSLEHALASARITGEAHSTAVRFRSSLASAYESVEPSGEAIPRLERTLGELRQDEVGIEKSGTYSNASDRAIQGEYPTAALSGDSGEIREREQIIREISHSLNTPLAQIELVIRGAAESISDPGMIKALERSEQSVQICRAVLAAYRDITAIAAVAAQWDIRDLRQALRSVVDVYVTHNQGVASDVGIEIDVPSAMPGYSNYMIISLLLPLLQNAVEAALPNTRIQCWADRETNYYFFYVSNTMRIHVDLEKLEIPHYTNKLGAHEGLGLSSVRTLLARQAHLGANLGFKVVDDRFIATIRLPRRSGTDD